MSPTMPKKITFRAVGANMIVTISGKQYKAIVTDDEKAKIKLYIEKYNKGQLAFWLTRIVSFMEKKKTVEDKKKVQDKKKAKQGLKVAKKAIKIAKKVIKDQGARAGAIVESVSEIEKSQLVEIEQLKAEIVSLKEQLEKNKPQAQLGKSWRGEN